jgi:hypothetical protein
VSILETAADKFVGLTRHAGAEFAGLDKPDPTLRHLHDLHALREHYNPRGVPPAPGARPTDAFRAWQSAGTAEIGSHRTHRAITASCFDGRFASDAGSGSGKASIAVHS